MATKYLTYALHTLAPNAEWKFNDDDLDTLEWFSTDIAQPTKEEILAQAKIEEKNEKLEIANRQKNKESALVKLIDLGLTEDEAKAFLG